MTCFSTPIYEIFERWKKVDLRDSLEASYRDLVDRRIEIVKYDDPKFRTPRSQATSNCQLLQQVLLHRAERLLVSSGTMLLDNNIYGLALIVRGHYETTAVLGYFCNRLESLAAGNISFDVFEWNIADAVLGAKHRALADANDPPNILTCLEKADAYLDCPSSKHLEQKAV